tara:strand:- start:366 stop:641 length:276 start_codon:yes stop_codon:yes gene_type:complete
MADEEAGSILSDLTEAMTMMEESITELSSKVEAINKSTDDILNRVIALEEESVYMDSLNHIINELEQLAVKLSNIHGGPPADYFFLPSRMR